MSLLGTSLIVLLAVLAVLFPVATYLLWSRVRGPRPVRAGWRVALLVGGQLTTLVLVAALANDYGDFYTSWSDLFGGGQVNINQATVLHAGGPQVSRSVHRHQPGDPAVHGVRLDVNKADAHDLRVVGDTNFSTRSQWAVRGRVEAVLLSGPQSGLSTDGYVYLPPQYFRHRYAHHRFPAVEVLTGYPGSAQGEVSSHQDYPGHALQAVRAHKAGPMVYVFLRSAVVPVRDTECTDIPGGPQAETYLAQDVPTVLQSALRVRPNDWGLMGDSTGGYCTTKILMHHPDTFRAGVSLSGYYHTIHDPTTGNLWAGRKPLKNFNNPEWLAQHEAPPPVSLMVTISKQERTYQDTVRFLHLIRPPMRVTAVILPTGGHNFVTWGAEVPGALAFLSQHLSAGS